MRRKGDYIERRKLAHKSELAMLCAVRTCDDLCVCIFKKGIKLCQTIRCYEFKAEKIYVHISCSIHDRKYDIHILQK